MSLYDPPIIATGGDSVQDIGGYRIHTFTTVGTSSFVVNRGGPVEVLVVAGGGGGGGCSANQSGGGGGAGELIYRSGVSVSGAISVNVGGGGNGGTTTAVNGTNGGNSVFGTLTALGGGFGGTTNRTGNPGGSGGGGGRFHIGGASTAATGLGNAGGLSVGNISGTASGGGGGGATSVGQNAFNNDVRTPGGTGYTTSISGAGVVYATGGSGGARSFTSNGANGAANTGNGANGGDGNALTNGGSGGSGIVIVRYPLGTIFTGSAIAAPRGIFTSTPNGLTSDQAATSGLALRQGFPNYTSGTYWIKPTAGSTAGLAFVDMTTDGGGWTLAYETVTATRVTNSIVYSINNSSNLSALSFTRVAYSMNNFNSWAFTSFDSWSSTISAHRVPSPNDAFVNQRRVTNLNIVSSNTNVITGTGLGGALEIWPYNYGTGRNLAIGTYGSDGLYDINDTHSGGSGYGSFQVHDITNLRPVICWNNHSAASPDIGFGPQATGNPDWTFTNRGATADFRVRVFVR
jgi:hypothetical protein